MKVLVVGSGGREHAICWKVAQSPKLTKLYCAPGNAGTKDVAENISIEATDVKGLVKWAKSNAIDLIIVGPEAPLAIGLVDACDEVGLKAFGPSQAAAQLEASKAFSKEVMTKAGVKTPRAEVFEEYEAAERCLHEWGAPVVIKADGLAAGKGVVVAQTQEVAIEALKDCLLNDVHASSGSRVLIEEFIKGREASIIAIVEGNTVKPFPVSQDYKRAKDGDAGANTGGMGAISPTPVFSDFRVSEVVDSVFLPVIKELDRRGIYFRGFLYAGVIIDEQGVLRVLEFNCRLGDPEAEVLLMRMESDFLEVIEAAMNNELSSLELRFSSDAAACVVAASKGYPGAVEDGKVIKGNLKSDKNPVVFHAGTKFSQNGEVVSKGGRILTVTARGVDIQSALSLVYGRLNEISFEGMQYRKDIGGGL